MSKTTIQITWLDFINLVLVIDNNALGIEHGINE